MSTFPLDKKVAVWPYLVVVMLPVAAKVPAVGSYISALAKASVPSSPPATSTPKLGNNVAEWYSLAVVILPIAANVPALGSYSSALAKAGVL
jgi:hypothetical protein